MTETVIDQTARRVPVIAQTGAVSTAEAIELSRHAQDAGASVLMLVTPYYEPLTLDETVRYLHTVAAVDVHARWSSSLTVPPYFATGWSGRFARFCAPMFGEIH